MNIEYLHTACSYLQCAIEIYRKFEQEAQALRCALQLNDMRLIKKIFYGCTDQSTQKQLAYLLARQQVFLNLDNCVPDAEELDQEARAGGEHGRELGERVALRELVPLVNKLDHNHVNDLKDILYNAQLSHNFLALAKEASHLSRSPHASSPFTPHLALCAYSYA